MPRAVTLPSFRPLPPRAPADARWRQSVDQLRAKEKPVRFFRLWLREFTVGLEGRQRSEARLRDSACALFVFLTLRPGLLRLVDVLLGAFAVLLATGLRPLACLSRTGHGLAVALSVVRAALQGRFGAPSCCARRAPRVHMSVSGSVPMVERHIAPIWDLARVPQRHAADYMPQAWRDRPDDRVLLVSGWLDVRCLGEAGHFVGLTWDGEVMCPRFGRVRVGDVREAALEILRRIPHVEEFWYFLLPPPGAVGEWPGAQPLPPHTPCWDPRVGRRRLYLVASTAASDWRAHRRLVRGFVDAACSCPPVHLQ